MYTENFSAASKGEVARDYPHGEGGRARYAVSHVTDVTVPAYCISYALFPLHFEIKVISFSRERVHRGEPSHASLAPLRGIGFTCGAPSDRAPAGGHGSR